MRILVVFLLAVLLAACTSASGSLTPIKAVGSASGDLSGPQVFIAGVPANALVKVHGNLTYTVQPFPPYLTYDGDYTIIVEPLPGKEIEAQTAVQRGDLLIRRNGVPGALNPPGSIAAYKTAMAALYAPKPAAKPTPPSFPPPQPISTVFRRDDAHRFLNVEDEGCVNGACALPTPR